jgi:hypothetical protein
MRRHAALGTIAALLVIPPAIGAQGCGSGSNGGSGDDGGPGSDGSNGGDGGSDGSSSDALDESAPPPCGSSPWTTYGHDSQRTGATDACIGGALSLAYKYVPVPDAMRKLNGVYTAIAQSDGVFVEWSGSRDPYLGTTEVDRVDGTGKRQWTWDSGTDSNLGNWLTLALGQVVVNEDGLTYLDPVKGTVAASNGVDNWGFTAYDATRIYAINSSHVDGPGIYVGAYDVKQKSLWQKNTYGKCRIDAADGAAGIAVDGDTLFYAPLYTAGTGVTLPFKSGVYAFAGADGTQKWFQPTSPASAISVGGGLIYLVEGDALMGTTKLVARKETDGSIAWSAPLMGAGSQAPVIAMGNIMVATQTDVECFDGPSGAPGWTHKIAGAGQPLTTLSFSGGCLGMSVAQSQHPLTFLAAALASQTLVVTAFDGIHVLRMTDGTEVWTGKVPMAPGAVHNPVLVGKRLIVEDGQALYALDAQ